jgi:hypothetical protein
MGTARRRAKLKKGYDSSLDRKTLNTLLHELEGILRIFAEHEPILPGAFVTLRRRCGKPGCRCRREKPHETRVFLERRASRRVTRKLPLKEERRLRKPVKGYRLLVRMRGRLTKLLDETLRTCDRLQAFRETEGKRIYVLRGRPLAHG